MLLQSRQTLHSCASSAPVFSVCRLHFRRDSCGFGQIYVDLADNRRALPVPMQVHPFRSPPGRLHEKTTGHRSLDFPTLPLEEATGVTHGGCRGSMSRDLAEYLFGQISGVFVTAAEAAVHDKVQTYGFAGETRFLRPDCPGRGTAPAARCRGGPPPRPRREGRHDPPREFCNLLQYPSNSTPDAHL